MKRTTERMMSTTATSSTMGTINSGLSVNGPSVGKGGLDDKRMVRKTVFL